ncbi:hypothetical protein GGR56DRAFT_689237 [Xylariaceae sp. FL0804]|nr:hypothetical protein GGR56DRAFT_689237 [Xylariaceae sp. FL0804]
MPFRIVTENGRQYRVLLSPSGSILGKVPYTGKSTSSDEETPSQGGRRAATNMPPAERTTTPRDASSPEAREDTTTTTAAHSLFDPRYHDEYFGRYRQARAQQAGISDWRQRTAEADRRAHRAPRLRRQSQQAPLQQLVAGLGIVSSNSRGEPVEEESAAARLVRGFVEATSEGEQPEEELSFVQYPRVTFLLDRPRMTCQICKDTELRVVDSSSTTSNSSSSSSGDASETEADGDSSDSSAPVILPCGHVACRGCMDAWCRAHRSCPFCRAALAYRQCRHAVAPRVVAADTVCALPPTVAAGGRIGSRCPSCREKDRAAVALARWTAAADRFRDARGRLAALAEDDDGVPRARDALDRARKDFERVPKNYAYETLAADTATW